MRTVLRKPAHTRTVTGVRTRAALRGLSALAMVIGMTPAFAATQSAATRSPAPNPPLPFAVGEELEYRVKLGSLGGGQGTMRVGGPERVRGQTTWALSFDFRARVALAVVEDRSRSWIDPERMAALRYAKNERTPLASHEERVEIYPDQRSWMSADGTRSASGTETPLDELSFIYYLRTLDLRDGAVHSFDQHFDPARNPVTVRVRGRERVSVPAGEFAAVLVEMEVRDPRRYGGRGLLRIHLTDDEHRIPVRIESAMPVVGSAVLSLERWNRGGRAP